MFVCLWFFGDDNLFYSHSLEVSAELMKAELRIFLADSLYVKVFILTSTDLLLLF